MRGRGLRGWAVGSNPREEDGGLARCGLVRVRAVDHVLADLECVVAADRTGRGRGRVRRADRLARGLHRLVALEHGGDERAGGDELDELAEERALLVLGVVGLGRLARELLLLQRDDCEALALEASEDLARQAAREGVRLDQDEGPVHGGVSLVQVRDGAERAVGSRALKALAASPAAPRGGRLAGHLGLAVRADLPQRIERSAALEARVLQLAQAARAAQEVL